MYVNTKHLHKLLYNVLLWTPGKVDAKKYASQGLVKMYFGATDLMFLSTDGYVVVISGNDAFKTDRELWFRGEDLKRVLQSLPNVEAPEIEVSNEGDKYFFGKEEVEDQGCNDENFWNAIEKIAFATHDWADLETFREFYLDPKRLQKFSLVEPRATYPLAFACRQTQFDQPVLMWKYGSDLSGIFSPLQVEAIIDAYPDDAEEVMW